jgi:hypothetical protein
MAPDNPLEDLDVPDPTDAEEVLDDLEPEVRDGFFGIPVVVPKGAPGVPGAERKY